MATYDPLARAEVDITLDELGLNQSLDKAKSRVDSAFSDMNRSGRAAMSRLQQDIEQSTHKTAQLAKEMGHVEVSARRAAQAIRSAQPTGGGGATGGGRSGGRGYGSGRGQGLLELAYVADDLQYGMRAIINNIPGLVAKFGGGAGLAGVAGIAAVAIGVLATKFESLSGIITQSTTWQMMAPIFQKIGDAASWAAEKIGDLTGITQLYNKAVEQSALEARKAKGDELVAAIAAEKTPAQQKSAATFEEALKTYGGAQKLLDDTMKRLSKGGAVTPDVLAGRKRSIAEAIDAARNGGNVNFGMFGKGFQNLYNASTPEAQAFQKQFVEAQKRAMKEQVAEQKRAEKERLDAREQEIAKHVSNIRQGPIGNLLLNNPNTNVDEAVRKQLEAVGVSKERSKDIAADVAWDLAKAIKEAVVARREQTGETEVAARQALLNQRLGGTTINARQSVYGGADIDRAVQSAGIRDLSKDMQLRKLTEIAASEKQLVELMKKGRAGIVGP